MGQGGENVSFQLIECTAHGRHAASLTDELDSKIDFLVVPI